MFHMFFIQALPFLQEVLPLPKPVLVALFQDFFHLFDWGHYTPSDSSSSGRPFPFVLTYNHLTH